MLPLPPFISPTLHSQNAPLLFSHYDMHMYMLSDFLSHPNAPIHIVYQPCPLNPHFRIFGPFLAIPPATTILPHPSTTPTTTFQSSPPPSWPIPFPCPCLPPCSHFRFFGRFMNALLHVFLSHFIYTCKYIIISIE